MNVYIVPEKPIIWIIANKVDSKLVEEYFQINIILEKKKMELRMKEIKINNWYKILRFPVSLNTQNNVRTSLVFSKGFIFCNELEKFNGI